MYEKFSSVSMNVVSGETIGCMAAAICMLIGIIDYTLYHILDDRLTYKL